MKYSVFCSVAAAALLSAAPSRAQFTDNRFADAVVRASNLSANPAFGDPAGALGKPTTLFVDGSDTYRKSLALGAFGPDPGGNNTLVSLGAGGSSGSVTVRFDQPITNDPGNPFGLDFTVFTNAFFLAGSSSDFVTPTTDLGQYRLSASGGIFGPNFSVSVSPDDISYYTFAAPATGFRPTNAWAWDRQAATFGAERDFTRPLDPALTPNRFAGGITAADSIDLFGDSAGGASFDLAASPFGAIRFIRVDGSGALDGFARVAAIPEPGTWILLGAAVLPVGSVLWQRRRRQG